MISAGKSRTRSTAGREMGSNKLHASAFLSTSGIRDREAIIQDLQRPLYRKDIFYSGSVYNLPTRKQSIAATSVASYVVSFLLLLNIEQMHDSVCKCNFRPLSKLATTVTVRMFFPCLEHLRSPVMPEKASKTHGRCIGRNARPKSIEE